MARLLSTPSRQDAQLVIAAGLLLYFGPKTVRWLVRLLSGRPRQDRRRALNQGSLRSGAAATDTKSQFLAAAEHVSASDLDLDSDQKLELYGLFKQANAGPCRGRAPSIANVVARAKWDAWSRLADMPREEAMKAYIARVSALCPEFGRVLNGEEPRAAGETSTGPRRKPKRSMGPGVSRIQRDDSDNVAWAGHEQAFALASAGKEDQLLTVLRTMSDVHKTDGEGRTLLHWAADGGLTRAAEALLERGVNVDVQAYDGMRALHCAVLCEQGDVAELLVRHGAEVTPDVRREASAAILPRLTLSTADERAGERAAAAPAPPRQQGAERTGLGNIRPAAKAADSSDAESLPDDIEDFADVDAADEETREAATKAAAPPDEESLPDDIEDFADVDAVDEEAREAATKVAGLSDAESLPADVEDFADVDAADEEAREAVAEAAEEKGSHRGAVWGVGEPVQQHLSTDGRNEEGGEGEGEEKEGKTKEKEDDQQEEHEEKAEFCAWGGVSGGDCPPEVPASIVPATASRGEEPAEFSSRHEPSEQDHRPADHAPPPSPAHEPAAAPAGGAPLEALSGADHGPVSPPRSPRDARLSFPGLASPPDRSRSASDRHARRTVSAARGGGARTRGDGVQPRRRAGETQGLANGGRAKAPAASPLGAPAHTSQELPSYREVVKGQASSPMTSPALTPAAVPGTAGRRDRQPRAAGRRRPASRGGRDGARRAGAASAAGSAGAEPEGTGKKRRHGRYRRRDRGGEQG